MKFFNFHLMPYADVDLDAIKKNGTAWISFSNSNFEPLKGAKLYNRYLDELEYSDQLGFDGVVVNEHHQTAYGLMPVPAVLAGALSRSVKKGKIGVLGRALPLVNNPLTIAEEYAMLDTITEGRLIAGFVRGIGAEYHSMGINPAHSKDRFNEAHDLIIRAWTEPGPFEFVGKHYHFKYVNPWPLPYQKPHPPIWVPSQGSKDTIEWAARMKYTYCQTLSPIKSVAKVFDGYRASAEKFGYTASPDQLAWSMSMFIAETDEKAREMAKPHIEALVNQLLSIPIQMLLPPGYTSPESLKKIAESGVVGHHKTIDNLIEEGVVIIGSPETAREKLEEFSELAGFGNILVKTQFGTMLTEMARENIEAIAREILPKFQD